MSYRDIHNSTGTICKARFRACPLEDSESGGHSESIDSFVDYHETNNDSNAKQLKELLKEGLSPKEALEITDAGYSNLPKKRGTFKQGETLVMKNANGVNLTITPGVIDDNAKRLYKEGQCMAFAISLAERTGGKVALLTYSDGSVAHAFNSKNGVIEDIGESMSLKNAKNSIAIQNDRAFKNNQPEAMRTLKLMSPKKMRKLLESNSGAFKVGSETGNISEQNFELAETFVESYMNQG